MLIASALAELLWDQMGAATPSLRALSLVLQRWRQFCFLIRSRETDGQPINLLLVPY